MTYIGSLPYGGMGFSDAVRGYNTEVSVYGTNEDGLVRVRWNFGDGTTAETTGTGAWRTSHTWADDCRYQVTAAVEETTTTYTVSESVEVYNLLAVDGATVSSTFENNYQTYTWNLPALTGNLNAKAEVFAIPGGSGNHNFDVVNGDSEHPALATIGGYRVAWIDYDRGDTTPTYTTGARDITTTPTPSLVVQAPDQSGGLATYSIVGFYFLWSPLNCIVSPPSATIQGRVFWDKNENKMRDAGEEIVDVPGVNFWVSPDWSWQQATDPAQDNCPNPGSYRKTNLTPANTWKVRMSLGVGEEENWEITSASLVNNVSGSCWMNASTFSLPIICAGNQCRTENLNLTSGETKNVWFGVKPITPPGETGSVSGRVWDDETGNKCLDGSEDYLSGATIELTLSGTTVKDTRISRGDGSYSFENLAAEALYDLQVLSFPGDYTSVTGWNDAADGSCRDARDSWGSSLITFYVEEGDNYRSVGLSEDPGAWITVVNGDVLSNNDVSMTPHPKPIPPYEPYFLSANPNNSGGVIIAQGEIRCFGCESPAKINERDWNVKNYSGGIPWPSIFDEVSESNGDLVYVVGNLTLSSNAAADTYNGKVVVVDGDITIAGAVTEIEAILASRGMITIEDSAANNDLEVTGALYAKEGFNLARTLNNNKRPAIRVIYDPSYLLSASLTALQDSRLMEWREVLPDEEEETGCTPISCTPTNWLPTAQCGAIAQTGACWNGCEVEYQSRTYNYGSCSDKTESCPAYCPTSTSLCTAHTVSCPRACVGNNCQDCVLSCTPYPNCSSCGTESTSCSTYCAGLETCSYSSSTASCNNTCSGGVCYDCTPSCGTVDCSYQAGSCGYTFCATQSDNLLASSFTNGAYQNWFNNQWNLYTNFTPSTSIKLTSLQVQIKNSGGAWRNVTTKITNSGGTSLTGDGTSDWLRSETKWLTINNFSTKPILEAGQTYRIYVKGPDSYNSLIWFSQNWQSTKPRNHRVYGDECL
ncbi:hypothetical protein L6258_01860 [Candidatus Parcubacteria bacterium]|nr:hypothetical protein [Candidatus Parcubacteria bacterium]